MDSSFYGKMVDDLADGIGTLAYIAIVFIPLGIWKMVDIVVWGINKLL